MVGETQANLKKKLDLAVGKLSQELLSINYAQIQIQELTTVSVFLLNGIQFYF